MNDRNKALLAFLAGATAGAALGLLFAPQSGKESREQLGRKGRQAKDALDDLIAEGRKKWRETKGKAADEATMNHAEVDDFVHFLMKEGKDLWDRLKEEAGTSRQHTGGRPPGPSNT